MIKAMYIYQSEKEFRLGVDHAQVYAIGIEEAVEILIKYAAIDHGYIKQVGADRWFQF